ncbi:MAG: hypothetical protein WCX22_00340 [Methanoregula sp.]
MKYYLLPDNIATAGLVLILCFAMLALPVSALTLTPGSSGSSSSTISKGDPVYITGIATGHPSNGLQVWLIGNNMAKVSTISVNSDNSYKYEITSAETQNLASGQYLVIIQHPMMNGQFDITYSPSTGQVINRQLGSGTSIFQLTSAGSLQSSNAASTLMSAINSQNIDDTFATASFYISPPDAFINPIGEHAVGDKFTITGSTNLAVGDNLQVDVYSSSFSPTTKSQSGEYSGASGVVQVKAGSNGRNQWSFDIDATSFKPDEYIVTVEGIIQEVKGSTTFTIVQPLPATTQIPETTATLQQETVPVTVLQTTIPAEVPTTQKSPVPVGIGAGSLVAALVLLNRKRETA